MSEEESVSAQEIALRNIGYDIFQVKSTLERIEASLTSASMRHPSILDLMDDRLVSVKVSLESLARDVFSINGNTDGLGYCIEKIKTDIDSMEDSLSVASDSATGTEAEVIKANNFLEEINRSLYVLKKRAEKEDENEKLGYGKNEINIAMLNSIRVILVWTNVMIATYMGFGFMSFLYSVIFK